MFFRRSVNRSEVSYSNAALKDVGDAEWVERLLAANVKMATLPRPLGCFAFTGSEPKYSSRRQKKEGKQRSYSGSALERAASITRHRIAKALPELICRDV